MKVAIGKKELDKFGVNAGDLVDILRKDNEVIIIDEEKFSNDDVKKERINVLITSDSKIARNVFSSISINTSTYIISSKDSLLLDSSNHYLVDYSNIRNVFDAVNNISKNRKPSKEKIWNRFYTDEELNVTFPEMTETDYIRSMNLEPDLCAYEFEGQKTSHIEHDSELYNYAGRLKALGVKKGDFVSICMPNSPELVKLKYCLEDIGCTANFIDPRSDAKTLQHCLNTGNSKILFILDAKYKDVEQVIDKTNIDKVFLVSPFESVKGKNRLYKTLIRLKGINVKNSGYNNFDDFLSIKPVQFEKVGYEKGHISSIQYTSGTTGLPKAVMIDGNSYNCRVAQYRMSNDEVNLSKGSRLLQALPISGLAFGEYALQIGMCKGMENVLITSFTPENFGKIVKNTKVNAFVIPPNVLYAFLKSKEYKEIDKEELTMVAIGGEGMSVAKTLEVNKDLKDNGCTIHTTMGGGCTEGVVCNTTEMQSCYKPGAAGIPLIGNVFRITDENGNELSYNQRGTLNYDPVGPMLGYYDNEELTKKTMTKNGIDLGDAGEIDEDGFVTYVGRKSQLIYRDDKIIYPHDIEEDAMMLNSVDFCVVTGKGDDIRLFFTVKNHRDINNALQEINELLSTKYKDIKYLIKIIPLKSIPYTKNCKTDREKLSGNIDELDLYNKKLAFVKRKTFGLHKIK